VSPRRVLADPLPPIFRQTILHRLPALFHCLSAVFLRRPHSRVFGPPKVVSLSCVPPRTTWPWSLSPRCHRRHIQIYHKYRHAICSGPPNFLSLSCIAGLDLPIVLVFKHIQERCCFGFACTRASMDVVSPGRPRLLLVDCTRSCQPKPTAHTCASVITIRMYSREITNDFLSEGVCQIRCNTPTGSRRGRKLLHRPAMQRAKMMLAVSDASDKYLERSVQVNSATGNRAWMR
jgi:hypothetical protein